MAETGLSLAISIVTYQIDVVQFQAMLASLSKAIQYLRNKNTVLVDVFIVNNGSQSELIESCCVNAFNEKISLIENKINCGYGSAHNQVIASSKAEYFLLMNPDVLLDVDVLQKSLEYLEAEKSVVAVSPQSRGGSGQLQYLCKRYPSLLVLVLRAMGIKYLQNLFSYKLDLYKYRYLVDAKVADDVELISGCFIFCRGGALRAIKGFDERFFLYFEDFALSIELRKFGRLRYLPSLNIVHYGGDAAKKGLKHIGYFAMSGYRFFSKYGWKLF